MILETVEVRNVRNIQHESFRLQPSLNLVLGPNGAGKTTFLECIYLLIRGRSFRPGLLNSLMSFDAEDMLVTATSRNHNRAFRIGISKARSDNIRMRLNGADIRQISQIAALVPTQTFLPDLSELVFGTPRVRRSWLNWSVFHTDNRFMDVHRSFLRLLQQRNRAVQQRSADLSVWTEQFVKKAIEVTAIRESHLQGLNAHFQKTVSSLAPDLNLTLNYESGWSENSLLEALQRDKAREQKIGHTRLGPHRADIRLQVIDANGELLGPALRILSRGQGNVIACALKLAQLEHLRERGVQCVVLLDDATAEMDEIYTRRFFNLLNSTGSQIIATGTKNTEQIQAEIPQCVTPNVIQLEAGQIVAA
ncbi:MAG: DNA replication/repair protein RecF [Gammaproteobacteria bacterium]|nr:DNA replication/repair protein RecF [Gammaproteobacteria bacterium]MYC24569.1 DNA replication/repair protein RecF [Gammaproteobacteria bacterium]